MSFLDVNTYTDKDYPGVKKNKKLLRDFLEDDIKSVKVIDDAKTTASYFGKLQKLNVTIQNNKKIVYLHKRIFEISNSRHAD